MTRGNASDSTFARATQNANAGEVNDQRDARIVDILTANPPCQPFTDLDGRIAALGRRLARSQALHSAIETKHLLGSPEERKVDGAQPLLDRHDEQCDQIREAVSYGRAETPADALTQLIIAHDAAEYLTVHRLKHRQVVAAGQRLTRIVYSLASYIARTGALDPRDYGARYLMPERLDYLAPNFLVTDAAAYLGEVVDLSAGYNTFSQAKLDGILALIAAHRRADDRLRDANDAIGAVRNHGGDRPPEAEAARTAEMDAAETGETEAFNALFSERAASTADLLALLRHVERHVEDSTGNEGSIELGALVAAIGDTVEGLRTAITSAITPASSPDAFLLGLAPELLPLLDEADARWTVTRALYEQSEIAGDEAAGPAPSQNASASEWKAWQARRDRVSEKRAYRASWDQNQPLFNRIESMVGPYMDVPAQTLDGLLLKERIGHTLEHFCDDAAGDLAKLARARFGYAKREPRS